MIFNIITPSNIAYVPIFIELAGISIIPRFKLHILAHATSCSHSTACVRDAPSPGGSQPPTKNSEVSNPLQRNTDKAGRDHRHPKSRFGTVFAHFTYLVTCYKHPFLQKAAGGRLDPYKIGIYNFYTLQSKISAGVQTKELHCSSVPP